MRARAHVAERAYIARNPRLVLLVVLVLREVVELGAAAGVVGGGSGQPLLTSMVSSLTGSDDTFFTATSSAASEAFFTELRFRAMYALSGCFIAGVGGLLCDRAKPGGCAPADGKQGNHDGIWCGRSEPMRKREKKSSMRRAVLGTMRKRRRGDALRNILRPDGLT